MSVLIAIPARMRAQRLPGKILETIGGKPMIVQCCDRAREANCGDVLVAAAEEEIANAVRAAGYECLVTQADLPSGTDRIACTLSVLGRAYSVILNLQGDLPHIKPEYIRVLASTMLADEQCGMATLVAPLSSEEDAHNANIVKAVCAFPTKDTGAANGNTARALYFTRARAPWGEGPLYHHIGIYGFRRSVLEQFVALPPGQLEQREKLEQLRALENGIPIKVLRVDSAICGIDTREELEKIRSVFDKTVNTPVQ